MFNWFKKKLDLGKEYKLKIGDKVAHKLNPEKEMVVCEYAPYEKLFDLFSFRGFYLYKRVICRHAVERIEVSHKEAMDKLHEIVSHLKKKGKKVVHSPMPDKASWIVVHYEEEQFQQEELVKVE